MVMANPEVGERKPGQKKTDRKAAATLAPCTLSNRFGFFPGANGSNRYLDSPEGVCGSGGFALDNPSIIT